VPGLSEQAFSQWRADPVSRRDGDDAHLINAVRGIHHDDPEFGYRFITDELAGGRGGRGVDHRARRRAPAGTGGPP
jgi:hypothetical protein